MQYATLNRCAVREDGMNGCRGEPLTSCLQSRKVAPMFCLGTGNLRGEGGEGGKEGEREKKGGNVHHHNNTYHNPVLQEGGIPLMAVSQCTPFLVTRYTNDCIDKLSTNGGVM